MPEGLFSASAERLPLIGRDDEIDRMVYALDRVVAGEGRLILVSGEPGIGKTRLVEELAAMAADQGAVVAWGRADDVDGAPPYWPWLRVLQGVLHGADRQALTEALGSAGPIAAILPVVKEFVPEITAPPLLDPAMARFRLHESIVDFLCHVSVHRRLVLVLDDLHWADAASLELTRFVAAELSNARLLLVVTYRSVDGGSSEPFEDVLASLARQPGLDRVTLAGLSQAEVGRFVAQTIGMRPRRAVVATVHARTEGNPFFVGELARLLQSEGLLGAANAADRADVPVGVRDVVRRRLVRLSRATNELLVLAAVVGREFDLAVLAGAANLGAGDLAEVIEPALSAGVIIETAGRMGRFRFSHALIRDTVYGDLSSVRRATLHARVGEALESEVGAGPRLAELAWHFFHAAPLVGPARGLGYSVKAAEAALAAVAYEQAEDDLRRALRLIEMFSVGPERDELELHVQNRLAALLTKTRGHADPEVGRACARARELSQRVGDTDELIATLCGLFNFHFVHADIHVAAELAQQLLTVGRQHSNTLALALGHFCTGVVKQCFDQLAESRACLAAGVSFARKLELTAQIAEFFRMHPLPLALGYVARTSWLCGDDSQAAAATEEAIGIARRLQHPYTLAFILFMSAQLAVLMADPPLAERRADDAIAACKARGYVMLESWSSIFHGWAIAEQGRQQEGVAEMTAALAAGKATGARLNTTLYLGLISDGERRRGNSDRALALVDEAVALAGTGDDRIYAADLHRRRGELLAASWPDRGEEAAESLAEAIAIARGQGAIAYQRRAEAALNLLPPRETPVPAAGPAVPADRSMLSARERELLALVGRGRTDKQIAADLTISLATVRSHLERIRDKTGRRRRAELTRLAVDLGLVSR